MTQDMYSRFQESASQRNLHVAKVVGLDNDGSRMMAMKDPFSVSNTALTLKMYLLTLCVLLSFIISTTAKTPEASSTLLKMHKIYTLESPHDTSLYSTVGVIPNATLHEIQKAYRRKSRLLHPDKNPSETAREKLEELQQAYEVLKDDNTRLLYHRFGLLDTSDAVLLLGGQGTSDPAYRDLLRLMGYRDGRQGRKQRVAMIAADLVERIRPLVEGTVKEEDMVESVIQETDRLKKLPLGSQILRCVGRAYRYAGKNVLRRYHASPLLSDSSLDFSDSLREKIRVFQHVSEAALHATRAMVTEQWHAKRSELKKNVDELLLEYTQGRSLGRLPGEDDDDDMSVPTDEELKEQEQHKVNQALLESLQVEAYWKVSKVDLDRTVREACELILTHREYFFFPDEADGWVGENSGMTMDAEVGRIRAAAALVMLGDIMVERTR